MSDATNVVYGGRVLDPAITLGTLAWYEVRNVCVPHATADAIHTRLNLTRPLPGEPTDANTFARVCTKGGEKDVLTDVPGVTANYLLRTVSPRLRRLVRELVNSSGEKLGYEQLADVRFDPTSGIKSTVTSQDADGERVLAALEADFIKWQGCLDSYAIREWIRGSLVDLRAVQVKSGVYFVAKEHQDTLDQIERFGLELPGQVRVRTLPLVDDLKQRAMVQEAFESEADQAMDALWTKVENDLASDRPIALSTWEARRDEFAELMAKSEGLSVLLEQQILTSDARTNLLQRMVNELYRNVKKEAAK